VSPSIRLNPFLTFSSALQSSVNVEDRANEIKKLHEHVHEGIEKQNSRHKTR